MVGRRRQPAANPAHTNAIVLKVGSGTSTSPRDASAAGSDGAVDRACAIPISAAVPVGEINLNRCQGIGAAPVDDQVVVAKIEDVGRADGDLVDDAACKRAAAGRDFCGAAGNDESADT